MKKQSPVLSEKINHLNFIRLNFKHLFQWIILAVGFLVSGPVLGQTIPVVITSPSQVAACDSNRFHASFTASSTFVLKISASILTGNQNTLNYTCQDSTPIFPVKLIVDTIGNSSVSGASFNSLDSTWVITVNSTGAISFDYFILVDCSVIQDSSFNNSINLNQIWTCQGCSFSFDLDSTAATSNSLTSSNIKTPRIIDISNTSFAASYQNSSPLYFEYRNNGNASAPIQFNFNPNTSGTNCDAFVSDSLHFGVRDSLGVVSIWNLLSPNSWMTAFIPINRSLVIRNSIRVLDCLSACTSQKSSFKWRCALTDTTDTRLCKDCQDEYISTYSVTTPNTMKAKLKLERIEPTLEVAKTDHSCPGTYVHWRYRITNTGIEDIPLSHAELYYYGQVDRFSDLSLIPRDSINWDLSGCPSCSIDTGSILKVNFLCQQISDPILRMDATIHELGGGEFVEFSFATYKCSSEDDTLLNVTKYFNQWMVGLTASDSCGSTIDAVSADPLNYPYQAGFNSSLGGISSHLINSDSDLNLGLEFIPTITDLTVPKGFTFGPYADLSMNLHGMFPSIFDYQLLGCNLPDSSSCQLQGFLRAKVHCGTGLRVENMATDVWLSHPDSGSMTPIYFYSSVPPNACQDGDYYFYFDLNDSAAFNIINSGQLNFSLQSCCGNPNDDPTDYSVTYSLLPNPGSCFTLGPQNNLTVPPLCNGCNWIPLSSKGNSINVHCPGCRQPGMIVDSYKMERLTYGFEDADDDRVADAPLQVIEKDSSYFQNHSIRSFVSMHGDYVQDLMVAHFEPGVAADSLNPTGYTYSQMIQSPNRALLDYLQLSRKIGESSALSMDLHPVQMLFYIDIPDTVSTMCMDCDDFQLNNLNYKTIQINSVDSTSINTFLSITADSLDNYYFYSFDVDSAGPQTLLNHVVYSDSLTPFAAFYEGQQYRMRVIYRNCGNFLPANLTAAESDDGFRESQINNIMWLSGKNQGYNATANVPFKPDVLPPGILDSTFSNGFLFICEVFGGRHYFVSNSAYNFTTLQAVNGELCNRRILSQAYQLIGGDGKTDRFPYEFRSPVFYAKSFEINSVPGFVRTSARVKSSFKDVTQTTLFHSATLPLTITIPPSPNPITIASSSYPLINCITQIPINSGDSSLYSGDQFSRIEIQIDLLPDTCQVGFSYVPDTSFSNIQFSDFNNDCGAVADTLICGTTSFSSSNKAYTTLELPYPLLALAVNDSVTYNNQVCWELTYTNPHVDSIAGYGPQGNNPSTYAPFVYLYVPDSAMVPQLSNWQFTFNGGGTISPDSNGFFHISNHFLSSNSGQINGQLCATINTCEELISLQVLWGWNCLNYPTTTDSLCYSQTDTLLFSPPSAGLNTPGKIFNPPVVLCDTLTFGASFASTKTGAVFTDSLFLDNMPPFFTIVDVRLTNCQLPGSSISLNSNLTSWVVSDSILIGLGYPGGFLSLDDSICVQIRAILECNFRNVLSLPDIILNGHNICDSLLQASANFNNTAFGLESSNCTDCFTLEKLAFQETTFVGDTTSFSITICGINGSPQTVALQDHLPAGFTPLIPIPSTVLVPADSCITLQIAGTYSQTGNCNDSSFVNTATIYYNQDSLASTACIQVFPTCAAQASTIVPDSSFASSYPGGFVNQTIYLDGRFYVDTNYFLFQNSTILVNAGGQIVLLPGASLQVDSSLIEGCDFMWQGVYMETNSNLGVVKHSIIRDADKAIYANNKTTLKLLNSSYEDNVRGLYVPPNISGNNISCSVYGNRFGLFGAGFKQQYSGQPVFGSVPYSGIEVNDVVMQIGAASQDSNYFFNMNTGILGFRSTLKVHNNKYKNIQPDILISPQPWNGMAVSSIGLSTLPGKLEVLPLSSNSWTMENCLTGVYTEHSKLIVYQVNMTGMRTGVASRHCFMSSSVSYCNIEASNYGIDWRLNSGATFMNASRNTITISGSKFGVGINLEELTTAGIPNYLIEENNNITIISGMAGIRARNVYNPLILKNTIYQNTNGVVTPQTSGILLENDSTGTVQCNTVTSLDINYTATYGMHISATKGTTISCNEIDSCQIGFHFSGLSPLNLSANTMQNNFWGLEIEKASQIGIQKNKGNFWLNYRDTVGAVHWDTSLTVIQNSEFRTSGMPFSTYWPAIPTWDNGWFVPLAGTEERCGHSCDVQELIDTTRDESLEMSIAEGTYESTQENAVVADQYLYDLLAGDSAMLHSQTTFEDFYLSHQTGAVGQINEVTGNIKSALQPDFVFTDSIITVDNALNNEVLNMYELDSLSQVNLQIDYTLQRELLFGQVDSIASALEDLLIQRNLNAQLYLDSASLKNQSVLPDQIPQENELFINQMNFELMKFGKDTLLNYYPQILQIAQQCPSTGGPAVYRARTLVALFNDTIDYENACLQNGSLRIQQMTTNVKTTPLIAVIPNPADSKIEIQINKELEGICKIEIASSLGSVVYSEIRNCKEKSFSINTFYLTPGIYSVKVVAGSLATNVVKLVIAR